MNKTVIKGLNIDHLSDVQNLQNKIFEKLHDDERHFILKRSAEDFIKALTSENTHMLGVFDGDELIGQCIFAFPENGKERDLAEFAADVANEDMVIYKAIAVDPQHRGTNLMKKMLDHIENGAEKMGKKTSIIQIALDNPASWINALRHGMSIQKVDKDPEDGVKVVYLQKKIGEKPDEPKAFSAEFHMNIGSDIHKEIPMLYNRMQYRIEKGYHGVKLEKAGENSKLIWSKEQAENTNNNKMLCLQEKLGVRTVI